ncbi:hypothetical protein ABWH92_06070 [Ahrensia marina]|uniref:hypothetical protein n=1 Tax=Ahrensia marina TaxID=1514904 RepID=UPI0035CF7D5F
MLTAALPPTADIAAPNTTRKFREQYAITDLGNPISADDGVKSQSEKDVVLGWLRVI